MLPEVPLLGPLGLEQRPGPEGHHDEPQRDGEPVEWPVDVGHGERVADQAPDGAHPQRPPGAGGGARRQQGARPAPHQAGEGAGAGAREQPREPRHPQRPVPGLGREHAETARGRVVAAAALPSRRVGRSTTTPCARCTAARPTCTSTRGPGDQQRLRPRSLSPVSGPEGHEEAAAPTSGGRERQHDVAGGEHTAPSRQRGPARARRPP